MFVGWKLGLTVVVVVTTAMAVAFFHFTAREKAGLVDAKQKAAEMVADLFAASLRAPLDFVDEDAVKSELDNLPQNRDVIEASVWLTDRAAPIGRPAPRRRAAATRTRSGALTEPATDRRGRSSLRWRRVGTGRGTRRNLARGSRRRIDAKLADRARECRVAGEL